MKNKQKEAEYVNQTLAVLAALSEQERKEEYRLMAQRKDTSSMAFISKYVELFGGK